MLRRSQWDAGPFGAVKMVQTISTIISLLLGMAGVAVILVTLMEDWHALGAALGTTGSGTFPPLPPRTRRLVSARPARMIVIRPIVSPSRVAV